VSGASPLHQPGDVEGGGELLKNGAVSADGDKSKILTDAHLRHLFDTPIELAR
jgi:hypothetical protein